MYLLDIPAAYSDTQELSAGTFSALVTGLFVGQSPVTRGLAYSVLEVSLLPLLLTENGSQGSFT